jgi:hypothetical protein
MRTSTATPHPEIRGAEVLEPQAAIKCVDCEREAGEEEGGYFTFPVSKLAAEIEQHGWHVIDSAVVCDDCAFLRDQEERDAA